MRSWRPLLFALLFVLGCADNAQEPILQLANRHAGGQPGWQWSNPKPQGNDLNDVSFFNENIGFAVGFLGAMVRTLDGGQTWTLQKSGVTDHLFGVATVDAKTAIAVGPNGIILRTTNRGATWERQQSGVAAGLQDVDFADANHGIAVGYNVMLRTSDGGVTWTSFDCDCSAILQRVCMVDANIAFAVGPVSEVYVTLDGGASWVTRPTGFYDGRLYGVYFTDAQTGTVVGEGGLILRTTDGGTTWRKQDADARARLQSVAFADANHGIVVGQSAGVGPVVMHTSDGGAHWIHEVNGTPVERVLPWFNAVSLLKANTGVAVGMAGNVIRTTDGGVTWEARTHVGASRLFAVSFGSADDGVAVGLGDILRTRDGGATWQRHTDDQFILLDVTHFGSSGVVAVGSEREVGGVIMRSTDAGMTWTTIPTGTVGPGAADFADASIGTTVGVAGAMLRTVDGGATWFPQASGTTEDLNDVSLPGASTGIAVGENSTIVRTTDGGALWQVQPHPELHADLEAVDFADSDVGFVVGNSNLIRDFTNRILRTTDGGATWVAQPSGTNDGLLEVVCVDRNSAFILARNRLLVTTDGGDHWTPSEPIIALETMRALAMSGRKTVTVVGGWGSILQNRHIVP